MLLYSRSQIAPVRAATQYASVFAAIKAAMSTVQLQALSDPVNYLGCAGDMVDDVLARHKERRKQFNSKARAA